MTPTEMSTNEKLIYPNNSIINQIKPPKFQIGDFVRVS